MAVLLPSLKRARESSRASVCGHHIRTLTGAGAMWVLESHKNRAPAHSGWAPEVLKRMSGQTEPFRCPSSEDVTPIAPVSVSQFSGDIQYTTLSADSGFFRRHNNDTYGPDVQGFYRLDMETEAFEEAGDAGGDADYNDAYLYVKPSTESAGMATCQHPTWAVMRISPLPSDRSSRSSSPSSNRTSI